MIANIKENEKIIKQVIWLTDKFGDGTYADFVKSQRILKSKKRIIPSHPEPM